MIKYYYRLCIALVSLIALFAINSCKKDISNSPQTNADIISQTQKWYEDTYPVNGSGKTTLGINGAQFDPSQVLKPAWTNGVTYQRYNKQVIEIPIDASTKLGTAITNDSGKPILKKEYSKSSFLFLKSDSGYKAYIMTIVADSAYLKNDLKKLDRNRYNKRDSDFSGFIIYTTPKGKLVSSWRYTNGTVTQLTTSDNTTQSTKNTTNAVKPNVWYRQCVTWTQTVTYNGQTYEVTNLGMICDDIFVITGGGGDGGSGGAGSGGVGGGGSGSPHGIPPNRPCDDGFTPPDGDNSCYIEDDETETILPYDPCSRLKQVLMTINNAVIAAQMTAIKNKLNTDTAEWRTTQNLQVWPGTNYRTTSLSSDAQTGSLGLNFYWDSTHGYTIGIIHDHPGDSAPSPDDVFAMIISSYNQNLVNAGVSALRFYQANVSITVVTQSANYVVTVSNWAALQQEYDKYKVDPNAYDDNFANIGFNYKTNPLNTGATDATATQFALLKTLGDAINLYKANTGTTNYQPLTLNKNTSTLISTPCN